MIRYRLLLVLLSVFVGVSVRGLAQELDGDEGNERYERSEREIEGPEGDEREFEIGERARREYLERLREHGIDGASMRDAWLATQGRREKRERARAASIAWEFLGPRNQSGRITGLGVSNSNPSLWYCAADGGGIWRSTTAGATWTPLTDTLPSLKMGTLALSPRNDQIVLGGTFEGMIYRSVDGGASWSVAALPDGGYVREIRFHPTADGEVLAGAEGGLYRSTDNGATWNKAVAGGRVNTIVYNPSNPSIIFYGQNDEGGGGHVWRSTDGGANWSDILKKSTGYWSAINVRLCAAQPNVLYACFSELNTFYKSTDGGDTWTRLPAQPYRDGYSRGFDYFDVSPIDPDIVFAGTTHIFRTTDGGASWVAGDTVNRDVHVDQHAFLFPQSIPGALIAGNDGGVFINENYIDSRLEWSARNNDLATLEIYNCAIHPRSVDTIVVGCQDNGYDKFTGDENNWLVVGGDGFCTLYDREQPGYFYHEYIYQNLHRSDDGFTWWARKVMNGLPTDTTGDGFYTGISGPERADWFGQGVIMSPADSKTLYMGTNFLYKTTDRAETWRRVSDREYARDGSDYITSMAIAPSRPAQLYLGTSRGNIYRVLDEGSAPVIVDITPSIAGGWRMRGIAVSNTNPNVIYVASDGGYDGKGVMMSNDGGAFWSIRSEGLPRAGVNRIIADPDSAGTLYCGTTLGFYYTRDAGAHWLPMPGFPNVEVWDIAFDARTRTLLAGTYGRGAIRAQGFIPPAYEPPASVTTDAASSGTSLDVITGGAGDLVRLSLDAPRDLSITLYDYLGREVARIHDGYLPAGTHQFTLGAGRALALPAGIYFVEVRGEGMMVGKRWVKV